MSFYTFPDFFNLLVDAYNKKSYIDVTDAVITDTGISGVRKTTDPYKNRDGESRFTAFTKEKLDNFTAQINILPPDVLNPVVLQPPGLDNVVHPVVVTNNVLIKNYTNGQPQNCFNFPLAQNDLVANFRVGPNRLVPNSVAPIFEINPFTGKISICQLIQRPTPKLIVGYIEFNANYARFNLEYEIPDPIFRMKTCSNIFSRDNMDLVILHDGIYVINKDILSTDNIYLSNEYNLVKDIITMIEIPHMPEDRITIQACEIFNVNDNLFSGDTVVVLCIDNITSKRSYLCKFNLNGTDSKYVELDRVSMRQTNCMTINSRGDIYIPNTTGLSVFDVDLNEIFIINLGINPIRGHTIESTVTVDNDDNIILLRSMRHGTYELQVINSGGNILVPIVSFPNKCVGKVMLNIQSGNVIVPVVNLDNETVWGLDIFY